MHVITTLAVVLLGWLAVGQWRMGDKLDKLAENKADRAEVNRLWEQAVLRPTCDARHEKEPA